MRVAISADAAAFPFRKLENAGLPTPTSLAAWETVSLFGISTFSRTYRAVGLAALTVLIGAIGQAQAGLPELLELFKNEQVFYNQLELAKQIVRLRDNRALAALEGWLNQEDRHVRGNVAFIFAGLKDKRGLVTIYAILDDRSDRPLGQGMPGVVGNINTDRWWLKSQIVADRYYAVHLLGELGVRRRYPC